MLGVAIVCDELFVPSLETMCEKWNIGPDVAGCGMFTLFVATILISTAIVTLN